MKTPTICFVFGILLGIGGFWLFADSYHFFCGGETERTLLAQIKQIKPQMTLDEVRSILGEPGAEFAVNESFPEFFQTTIPPGYDADHGALSYTVAPFYVLIVFFDDKRRVSFVSCTTS